MFSGRINRKIEEKYHKRDLLEEKYDNSESWYSWLYIGINSLNTRSNLLHMNGSFLGGKYFKMRVFELNVPHLLFFLIRLLTDMLSVAIFVHVKFCHIQTLVNDFWNGTNFSSELLFNPMQGESIVVSD